MSESQMVSTQGGGGGGSGWEGGDGGMEGRGRNVGRTLNKYFFKRKKERKEGRDHAEEVEITRKR